MKNLVLTFLLLLNAHTLLFAQQKRSYYEINAGIARIYYDGYFPGVSFLIGQQKFIAPQTFLEYQVGLALPSIATAKVGIGYQGEGIGFSAGLRLFPTLLYGQTHFNLPNGQINISAEIAPIRFENLDFGPSFGADHIFTVGYQWNIGKSRKK